MSISFLVIIAVLSQVPFILSYEVTKMSDGSYMISRSKFFKTSLFKNVTIVYLVLRGIVTPALMVSADTFIYYKYKKHLQRKLLFSKLSIDYQSKKKLHMICLILF